MRLTCLYVGFIAILQSEQNESIHSSNDYFYWAVKYNDSTLFSSNKDRNIKWAYSISRSAVQKNDTITLIMQPDYSLDLNPAVIIKDSTAKNLIRYFPGTDRVAVKDILSYMTMINNTVWLLYTHKEPEKDGTVLWDINDSYPWRRGSPRLYLRITE